MKKEIAYSFFFTIVIFLLNYSLRTMLQFDQSQWHLVYALHQTDIPFKLRPFTNITMFCLFEYLGLSIKTAFILHQYLLVFVFFVSLSFYFKSLQFDLTKRLVGLSLTMFTFPILCLHFVPNYTWDNLWMYICLIWFGYFLHTQKLYLAGIVLFVASLSHESALFVLVSFYYFRCKTASHLKWILPALIPVVCYFTIRTMLFPVLMEGRFTHLSGNFENGDAIRQTLHSLFVSFGWMWALLLWAGWKYYKSKNLNATEKSFLFSSIIISVITVVSVLFVGKARETRLFFTPFIFILPLVLMNLDQFIAPIKKLKAHLNTYMFLGIILTIFFCSTLFTVFIFPTFTFLPMIDFHRVYFSIHLSFILLVLISYFLCRKRKKSQLE